LPTKDEYKGRPSGGHAQMDRMNILTLKEIAKKEGGMGVNHRHLTI
jgi:hypothetical protein